MNSRRLICIAGLTVALSVPVLASQKSTKATKNPPASSQATKHQPASHVTQGTIASMDANQLVLDRKGHGKGQKTTFTLNSQTQQTGNVAVGSRVSVQYREENNQKIASAVREMATKSAAKPAKASSKPGSKS
jgi:hypothetical protein